MTALSFFIFSVTIRGILDQIASILRRPLIQESVHQKAIYFCLAEIKKHENGAAWKYNSQINSEYMSSSTQKMKFSIKDFFSKCDQIRRKLRIWSHLQKKCLTENFIFCPV